MEMASLVHFNYMYLLQKNIEPPDTIILAKNVLQFLLIFSFELLLDGLYTFQCILVHRFGPINW